MAINEILESFESWLDDQAKNQKWLFKIYLIKNSDQNPTKKDLVYINGKSSNKEESILMLEKALNLLLPNGKEFIVIEHISQLSDPNGLDLVFKNPLYKKNMYQSSSISGIDNMQYLSMQEKHFREIQDLKDQINQIKQDHKIDELENRISGILEEKKTTFDLIQGFLESSAGKTLIQGVTQIINAKMNSSNAIPQTTQEVKPDPVPEPVQDTDQNEVINRSMANLSNVFGNDVIENLYHLSNWVNNNPELATSLIGQIKGNQNGSI